MKVLDDVLEKLSLLLLFINAILYTYSYLKGNKSKTLKYFVTYLNITFCVLLGSILIVEVQRKFHLEKNNLFLSHCYFIFQFIFLSLFYGQLFNNKQKSYQKIISVFVFSILVIQYALRPSLFFKFNLLEIFITSFPLVIYSIIHLYNSLSKQGKFMHINAGVLIYLSTSTLIFFLGNYIIGIDKSISFNVWFLNKLFYVGYLILILIEWRKNLWIKKN